MDLLKMIINVFRKDKKSVPQPVCGHIDCWDGELGKGEPCTKGHPKGYETYNKEYWWKEEA